MVIPRIETNCRQHLDASTGSIAMRLFVLFLGYGFAILIGLLPKLWLRFTALLGAKLLSLSVD